ncbi:MAG: succinate dehydrogenase assembly factor 2 [Pseudomonadota bacterium]
MVTEIEYKKLVWHSRRGMLELDLLLLPFARERVPELDAGQQEAYVTLLRSEDQDLFAWLVDREQHADPAQQALITEIRRHAKQRIDAGQ